MRHLPASAMLPGTRGLGSALSCLNEARFGIAWGVIGSAMACFESALGVVGRRARVEVGDVSIDSHVSLLRNEQRGFKLAVELDVTLPQVQDPEQATRLVADAHQVCPYSNATRGNIDVKLTANGRTVG